MKKILAARNRRDPSKLLGKPQISLSLEKEGNAYGDLKAENTGKNARKEDQHYLREKENGKTKRNLLE